SRSPLRFLTTTGSPRSTHLPSAPGFIRILRKVLHECKERRRLSDEKPHVREELEYAHGDALGLGRPNDRTWRQLSAQEWARLRHDQAFLQILADILQIRKRYRHTRYGIDCSQRRRIARLVRPRLKVHGLSGADADQDSQDFRMSGPLRHRGIEAVTTLFDRRKVKRRSIGDRLKEIRIRCVSIRPGNCRMLPNGQSRDRRWEGEVRIQVRIMVATSVASPPTGVQGKLREVCKP